MRILRYFHFLILGAWITSCPADTFLPTLSKVQIKGPLIGKEKYRQYYSLELGEPFDERKHQHGVDRIRDFMKATGYLEARVIPQVKMNKKNETISIVLQLEPGNRFVIECADVVVRLKDSLCEADCYGITMQLQEIITQALEGNYCTKEAIDEVAKRLNMLLKQQGFLNASIEFEQKINFKKGLTRVTFIITLRHKKAFEFVGNHYFSRGQLLERILAFGKSAILIPPSLIAEEIVALYKKNGFWSAKVTWEEEPNTFFFLIEEGCRIAVPKIVLEGIGHTDAALLIADKFNNFLKKKAFDGDLLKESIDNLIDWYAQEGFWDFEVVKQEYKHDQGFLIIRVDEGRRRFLKKITYEAFSEVFDELFSDPKFARYRDMLQPIAFDLHIIPEMRQWLMKHFQKKGFLYAMVKSELVEKEDGIILQWVFSGGNFPVSFGKTVMKGSSRIPQSIIERELQYDVDQVWNRKKIEKTVARLKGLGIFDVVTLYPENLMLPETHKTMFLKCIDDDPFEIRARLGIQAISRNFEWKNGITPKAGATFLWKNVSNHADIIRVVADANRYMKDMRLSYELPWLWRWPILNQYKVYSSSYEQPVVIGSRDILYKATQHGFLAAFTRKFENWQVSANSGFEWMRINDISRRLARAINFDTCLLDRQVPYWFVEPSVFADYLDDKVQPTSGSLSVISFKSMIPLDKTRVAFAKVLFEYSKFFKLFDPVVFCFRVRGGTLFHPYFKQIMPTERFYLGGAFSLRGYEPDLAPPLNVFRDCNKCRRFVPTGGRAMININLELRFPIYSALGGVVFSDMGALAIKDYTDVRKNFVGASGFGLRIYTPVGPLRFDIGWKWHRLPDRKDYPRESSYAWFLTLGNAF